MKVVRQKEVTLCDFCQAECYGDTCLKCGKEACYECGRKHFVTYPHSMHCSGSGDGHYCLACDLELAKSNESPLHSAYTALARLRVESESFYADLNSRAKAAEKRIESLRAK